MSNILVGKTITGMKIASDKEAILFQTAEGDIVAQCDADCCSHTWIENVELPVGGFPALVLVVERLELPKTEEWDDGQNELTQFYGLKIVTDRGEIILDYRNASNGYYGGWLSWPGDDHYGGVFNQNDSSMEWVDIKDASL